MRGKATETEPGSFWVVDNYLIPVIISSYFAVCVYFLFVRDIVGHPRII